MKTLKLSLFALFFLFASCLDDPSPSSYDDTEDQAFLEEYAQQTNVTKTNSGLLYRVIEEGEGEVPGSNDIVVLDIMAEQVVTEEVAIDTYDRGFTEIVPLEYLTTNLTGLKEAVQLMQIGAIYELVLPSQLAWRDDRVYKFTVELHTTQNAFVENYTQQEGVTTTESGLRYRVIEEGEGDSPQGSSTVVVNYTGTLINGATFDSGESSSFAVGGVIEGFGEGLQLMKTGATYEFLIPADIGYGENSPGYPGAVLMFEVDLLEIE